MLPMHDAKADQLLLAALRQARSHPGDHRLFRAGKLPGLFPSRTGPAAEAATAALQQGLLELVRNETKGKTTTEWVRLTAQGVDYLHQHDSPLAVLRELRQSMMLAESGLPAWLDGLAEQWRRTHEQLTEQVRSYATQLASLRQRVDEALRRLEASRPTLSAELAEVVPWGVAALTHLDRRREVGLTDACPLPELFAALRPSVPDLSTAEFQDGLRRLRDAGSLQLLPFAGPLDQLPDPVHALPEGGQILYYARR